LRKCYEKINYKFLLLKVKFTTNKNEALNSIRENLEKIKVKVNCLRLSRFSRLNLKYEGNERTKTITAAIFFHIFPRHESNRLKEKSHSIHQATRKIEQKTMQIESS
jgi:hypothetical protein